jgi:hypothetical protein
MSARTHEGGDPVLGRKDFTHEELDAARASLDVQLAAYRALAETVPEPGAAARDTFEALFCDNLALALDRRFVHRLRTVTGRETNPLSELELVADSLIDNGGVFRTGTVVRYESERSMLGLKPGDRIRMRAEDVERLSHAVLDELEKRFVA